MEFTLNADFLAALTKQLQVIDEALSKSAGNVAERRKAAEAIVQSKVSLDRNGSPWRRIEAAQAAIALLTDEVAEAKNAVNEAINGHLRAQKDSSSLEADALREQRSTIVDKLTAAARLLEITVDLPKAPKGSGSPNGHGRVKTSKGVFSYRREGSASWTVPCEDQQSLSSIASRVFDHAPVEVLRTAMGNVDETKGFEVTPTCNGKTASIRFEVSPVSPVSPAAPAAK